MDASEFSIILATRGLAGLIRTSIELEQILIADGTPNQASLIRRATSKLEQELTDIGAEIAVEAHTTIQHEEAMTRVRPDTGGGGGPRLGDFIGVSSPLPTVPGSVGINHEPTLDNNGVGWWWTQEEGYAGHVGRTFIGAFDGTRPEAQYAQGGPGGPHALLKLGKSAGGNRGKGTIRRPITERRFVRGGAHAVEGVWHAKIRAAKTRFMDEVRAAMASSAREKARRARP